MRGVKIGMKTARAHGGSLVLFPPIIQLQTVTGCNARCIFCPQQKIKSLFPEARLSDELFEKIVAQCAAETKLRDLNATLPRPQSLAGERACNFAFHLQYYKEMRNRAPYIRRSIEPVLRQGAREFPALVLTGPRQSGKTTTLKRVFGKGWGYVSLEAPDRRLAATNDPRGFLDLHPPPVILDEVQYAPELLPYIKERIDTHRHKTGQYLLSGSQNLLLMERVTESLAGRARILRLLPLSSRELCRCPGQALPWERIKQSKCSSLGAPELWRRILRGGYPELAAAPGRDPAPWHGSYVQTYLERDLRQLRNVGDLGLFQSFLRALAARSAQLLVLSDLARDLGVAVNTIKAWLSILEASYQVLVLRPYYANVGKRLVKTPKVYFTDVGTLCYLSGLRDPAHAAAGPMGGALMETLVLSEIFRTLVHRGEDPQLHFYRTSAGTEVDILVESAGRLVPIEVKLSSTPKPSMARGIQSLRRALGDRVAPGYVVHPGDVTLPLGEGTLALPFTEL